MSQNIHLLVSVITIIAQNKSESVKKRQPSGLSAGKYVPYTVRVNCCAAFSYSSLILLHLHPKLNHKVSVLHV